MEKNYELNIYDLLQACLDFVQEPLNDEARSKFFEFRQKIQVTEYLSIIQKELCLRHALSDLNLIEKESSHFTTAREIAMLFDCLLSYVMNLDLDIPNSLKDYDTYDLLYLCGIPQYILSFCKDDYTKLENLMYQTFEIDNMQRLMKDIENFSSDSVDEMNSTLKKFMSYENGERIARVSELLSKTDPLVSPLIDAIKDRAVNIANTTQNSIEKS